MESCSTHLPGFCFSRSDKSTPTSLSKSSLHHTQSILGLLIVLPCKTNLFLQLDLNLGRHGPGAAEDPSGSNDEVPMQKTQKIKKEILNNHKSSTWMQPCLKSNHFSLDFSNTGAKTCLFMFKLGWQSLFVAHPTSIFLVFLSTIALMLL